MSFAIQKKIKITIIQLPILGTNHTEREGKGYIRQNLSVEIETRNLTPTQFCHLPGFYRQT